MKRTLLALALTAFSAAAFAQQKPAGTTTAPAQSLAIGADIPMADYKMTGMDATPVSLGGAKTDKGLLVMFSCNTCPFVVKAESRTQDVMRQAQALGIGMVIINSNTAQRDGADSRQNMVAYGKTRYPKVPYLLDEGAQLANAFGATRTPEVYLFDGSGKLVYKGAMEDNPGEPESSTKLYLGGAMKNMIAGLPIDPATTKSVGCSIKR